MTKELVTDKYIVRIHGEVDKDKLLKACKTYAEKVNLKEVKNENSK